MYKKVKVSIFTTRWGHVSIAESVKESLDSNQYQIFFNNIPVEKVSELSYMPLYKLFPQLSKFTFKASEQKQVSEVVKKYLHQQYKSKIEKQIKLQKPEVIVNTYFAFNYTLEQLSQKYKFLYLNIVADPRTINKMLLTKIGYNFVFDQDSKDYCLKLGISSDKTIKSGWFTQNKFYSENATEQSKKDLGISKNDFTILIVGGSWGNYSILKTLPAFINPQKKVNVIFVAGESKTLQKGAEVFSKMFRSENLKMITLEFTNELEKYIKASDLVIGKAGPNLLFESVAARKPFIAVSHIHGQEDGNLEIIRKYKLGFVEENQVRSIKLIRRIIKNPEELKVFHKSLKTASEFNKKSGEILKNFISKNTSTN